MNIKLIKIISTILFAIPLIVASSCSGKNETGYFDKTQNDFSENLCQRDTLFTTSENFLTSLLNDDIKNALTFYAKNHENYGEDYGIEYTFFPKRNPNAIYDIIQKNHESRIFVENLGVFRNGYLIGFFQESAKGQTTNIEYLSQNHWNSFFVCNFVCTNNEWKISEHTCFEDSGSPFD